MAGFHRTVLVNRPIESVFDYATDLSHSAVLMPTIVRTEMVTDGKLGAGSKFRETRLIQGKERSAIIEVIEHSRPTIHVARASMMGMSATYRFRFSSEGAGTRVYLDAEVTGNFLWKIFLGKMSRIMEKEDGDLLPRLKAAMEAGS